MTQDERTPEELREILQRLKDVQEVDIEILQVKDQMKVYPGKLKQLDTRLAEEQAEHEKVMNAPGDHELERRKLELEIKEIDNKIEEERKRQHGKLSNEAHQAISREIDFLEKKKDKAETRILETLEEEESYRERLSEVEERFSRFKTQNDEERARIQEQVKTKKGKIERLLADRERLREKVPQDVLRLYDRLSPRTPDVVVPAVNSHCGGCHILLVSQKMVEIRQMKKFIQCEGCLRVFSGEENTE